MAAARFKLVFFSPRASTQPILKKLFSVAPERIGRIGEYQGCAFVTPGTGQFTPTGQAKPTIGTVDECEFVEEDRVEVLVTERGTLEMAIGALKKAHPYEEVAYDVYALEEI